MSALQFRRKRGQRSEETPQGLVSFTDWNRRSVKYGLGTAQAALLVLLVIVGLGPILWLAKAAITPTQDTLIHPMAVFPHGTAWSNVSDAWSQVDIGLYLWNTIAHRLRLMGLSDHRCHHRGIRALGTPAQVGQR